MLSSWNATSCPAPEDHRYFLLDYLDVLEHNRLASLRQCGPQYAALTTRIASDLQALRRRIMLANPQSIPFQGVQVLKLVRSIVLQISAVSDPAGVNEFAIQAMTGFTPQVGDDGCPNQTIH